MSLLEFLEKWGMTIFVTIILPVLTFIFKATFATKKELEVEKQRITVVENKVDALPSAKEFYELNEKLVGIAGDIKTLNKELVHITKNVDLLVQAERKAK